MQRGDSTSTDDPDGGVRAEVAASPPGGLSFGQSDPASAFTAGGGSSPNSSPSGSGDGATSAPATSLPGPVSVSTDTNNPSQVPEVSAAAVGGDEGPMEEAENSLVTALVATFAVLASTLVVLIVLVAVLSALRRRRKKEWLRYSEADLIASGGVRTRLEECYIILEEFELPRGRCGGHASCVVRMHVPPGSAVAGHGVQRGSAFTGFNQCSATSSRTAGRGALGSTASAVCGGIAAADWMLWRRW